MQTLRLQDVAESSLRFASAIELNIGQWVVLHTAQNDYIAKVEKLQNFDGHWQVRVYVPALGKSLWQYWNHLQPIQKSAQAACVGNRVRFMQRSGIVGIGEIIARREREVLVRSGQASFALPLIALVEVIGRLR